MRFLALVFLLSASLGHAAIAVDGLPQTATANTGTQNAVEFTTGSGSNTLLLAVVNTSCISCYQATGVTWNGKALTRLVRNTHIGSGSVGVATELYYLKAPDASTTALLWVSMTANNSHSFGGISYSGVDQTTPLGTPNEVTSTAVVVTSTIDITSDGSVAFVGGGMYLTSGLTEDADLTRKGFVISAAGVSTAFANSGSVNTGTEAYTNTWAGSFGSIGQFGVAINPFVAVTQAPPSLMSPYLKNSLLPRLQPERLR